MEEKEIKDNFSPARANDPQKGHSLRVADMFKLSLRVFRTRPTRTMLTILGISLGVGIVLFLVSLGYGLQYTLIGRLVTTEDSLITIEAYYPPDSGISIGAGDIEKISANKSVASVSPVGEFPAEIRDTDPKIATSSAAGFLFAKIVNHDYFKLSGTVPDTGKSFTEKNEGFIISSAALKVVNVPNDSSALGKTFYLRVLYADKDGNSRIVELKGPMKVIGIVRDDVAPPFIILPEDYVTEAPPYYARVLAKAKNSTVIENLRDDLIGLGFLVSTHIDLVNQAQKVMSVITIILGVFGVTALIVSAIGMFNTMIISFLERTFEVGIMKAIGATNRDIRNLFLMESLVMGLLGGIGGVLIGIILGEGANFGLNLLAKNFGGREISLFVRPLWFEFTIIGFSGFIGLLSGFLPARRATKISPKEAFIRK